MIGSEIITKQKERLLENQNPLDQDERSKFRKILVITTLFLSITGLLGAVAGFTRPSNNSFNKSYYNNTSFNNISLKRFALDSLINTQISEACAPQLRKDFAEVPWNRFRLQYPDDTMNKAIMSKNGEFPCSPGFNVSTEGITMRARCDQAKTSSSAGGPRVEFREDEYEFNEWRNTFFSGTVEVINNTAPAFVIWQWFNKMMGKPAIELFYSENGDFNHADKQAQGGGCPVQEKCRTSKERPGMYVAINVDGNALRSWVTRSIETLKGGFSFQIILNRTINKAFQLAIRVWDENKKEVTVIGDGTDQVGNSPTIKDLKKADMYSKFGLYLQCKNSRNAVLQSALAWKNVVYKNMSSLLAPVITV